VFRVKIIVAGYALEIDPSEDQVGDGRIILRLLLEK